MVVQCCCRWIYFAVVFACVCPTLECVRAVLCSRGDLASIFQAKTSNCPQICGFLCGNLEWLYTTGKVNTTCLCASDAHCVEVSRANRAKKIGGPPPPPPRGNFFTRIEIFSYCKLLCAFVDEATFQTSAIWPASFALSRFCLQIQIGSISVGRCDPCVHWYVCVRVFLPVERSQPDSSHISQNTVMAVVCVHWFLRFICFGSRHCAQCR